MEQSYMKKLPDSEFVGHCVKVSQVAYNLLISAGYKPTGIGFERVEDDYFPHSRINIHPDRTFANCSHIESGYAMMYEREDGFYSKNPGFVGSGFALKARAKRLDNDEYFVGEYVYSIDHNPDQSSSIVHLIKQENQDKYYSDFTTHEVDPTTIEYGIGDMWISAEVLKNTITKAVA